MYQYHGWMRHVEVPTRVGAMQHPGFPPGYVPPFPERAAESAQPEQRAPEISVPQLVIGALLGAVFQIILIRTVLK